MTLYWCAVMLPRGLTPKIPKANLDLMTTNTITICAQATAPGNAGVSIVRLSGSKALSIGQQLSQHTGTPRYAHYGPFVDEHGRQLDRGISLFFKGPDSYTGEDVFELQSHGGQVLVDLLLRAAVAKGAQLAKPGEFSERAFLNDKLDLLQAEAIADLIHANSAQAARNAARSLQGDFSQQIDTLLEQLINLRLFVEAAIDFPEEEIDFLGDGKVVQLLHNVTVKLNEILQKAQQGKILQEGMQVVIVGAPNAGKSSLLNALAGHDRAIVTNIAGTTRDTLTETITIDGLPLHIIDTAGLRANPDTVEKIGIDRALTAITQADHVLLLEDATENNDPAQLWHALLPSLPMPQSLTFVRNKIDLEGLQPKVTKAASTENITHIYISAKQRLGIELLRQNLKQSVGYDNTLEGGFSARRRHIDALLRTQGHLQTGMLQLETMAAGELLAEDLRQAQECLNEITGQFTSDDLLGKIFGSFCIGK